MRPRSERGRPTPTLVFEERCETTGEIGAEVETATPCSVYETVCGPALCKAVAFATSSTGPLLEIKVRRPTLAREKRKGRDARRPLV